VSAAILPLSIALYVSIPLWMLVRGWPFRAGLLMVFAALLPWIVWLTTIRGRLGPGAGIVMMLTGLMLLLALVPMCIGVLLKARNILAPIRDRAG
jgi:hypothetical protein